jgi:hypothetical protein
LVAGLAEQKLLLDALKTDNTILKTRVLFLQKSCEDGTKALNGLVEKRFQELVLWVRVIAKELLDMRKEQKRTPIEAPMDMA